MIRTVQRKCQGCAKISDREDFIKITLNDGKLHINPSSKIIGRSMYICPDIKCIKNVIKKKRILTSLKFRNFEEISDIEKKLLDIVSV